MSLYRAMASLAARLRLRLRLRPHLSPHLSPHPFRLPLRRAALAAAALAILLAVMIRCAGELLPRQDVLRISGGRITGNRHFLARNLQQEAAAHGVRLELRPTAGSQEALAQVAAGKLDLAFIQGGQELPGAAAAGIVHVATLSPELLHLLVRPGIADVAGLRGKRVNLGSTNGGTRIIAKQVLRFAGLREEIDYVESNVPTAELLTLRTERLPDALAITSFAPSELVEHIVRRHGYTLLDLPFAPAFAQRHDWAVASQVPAYTYGVAPPVPAQPVAVIGAHLRLVAGARVDQRAIVTLLESLYGARLATRLKLRFDEADILASASYPPAEGTRRFMRRHDPLFSSAALDKFKAGLGLLVSVVSTLLVIARWARSALPWAAPPASADTTLAQCLARLAELEASHGDRLAHGTLPPEEAVQLDDSLSALKAAALGSVGKLPVEDKQLPGTVLAALAELRARLASLRIAQSLGQR